MLKSLLVFSGSTLFITGVALCVPGTPPASTDAAAITAHVRAALGLERWSEHPAGFTLSGAGRTLGNDAETEAVVLPGGRFRITQRGPISITRGFDGTTAWTRDIAGEPSILELDDRTEALLEAWPITGWCFDPGSGCTFAIDAQKSTVEAPVLRLTLPDDPTEVRVTIDSATNLPTTSVVRSGATTTTTTVTWAAPGAGPRFPSSVEIVSSAGGTTRLVIDRCAPRAASDPNPTAPDLAPPNDTTFNDAKPAALEVVKAPTGHLLVHPLVDGKDVGWFIFDTGAGINVLDASVVKAEGLTTFGEVPATGVGGSIRSQFCRPKSIELGRVTVNAPLTAVMDLSFLDGPMGRKIGGLIGYGFMARSVVELDARTGIVALHDPRGYTLRKDAAWSRLIVSDRVPCVPARFEGHEGVFRLDTGAGDSTVTFHAPAVERFQLLAGRTVTPARLGGVGGAVAASAGSMASFELGGERFTDVPVTFATEHKGSFANPGMAGNLGSKLIAPFSLVLDYSSRRMSFVRRP